MPNEIFNHLKKVRVRGNPLNIGLLGDTQNTDTLSNAPEATSGRKSRQKAIKSNPRLSKVTKNILTLIRAPVKKEKNTGKEQEASS